MTKTKHYDKAPIIEAVLDLQVAPCSEFSSAFYNSIKAELSKDFTCQNIDQLTVEIKMGSKKKMSRKTQAMLGVRFESIDGKYVIQAKESGYAFSILNIYDCWEDFSGDAYKYWNLYKKIFKPQKVTRVALRYINRIDIPETKFELKKYFNVYPHIFKESSSVDMAGFFMQSQIPQLEGGVANLTQAVAAPAKAGCTSIVLDIDVFENKHFKPSSKELKDRIELLRAQKNNIFMSAITSETEELIT